MTRPAGAAGVPHNPESPFSASAAFPHVISGLHPGETSRILGTAGTG